MHAAVSIDRPGSPPGVEPKIINPEFDTYTKFRTLPTASYTKFKTPSAMFSTWIACQTNRLARRNRIGSIFTDPKQQRLSRMVETLPQGMKRNDPLYWWYVVLEGMIFFMGAANIGVELWKWQQHADMPSPRSAGGASALP